MDAGTATVVAAVVGAGASIVVAWITTRAKSGEALSKGESSAVPSTEQQVDHPAKEKGTEQRPRPIWLRVVQWILVGYIYLIGIWLTLFGLVGPFTEKKWTPAFSFPLGVIALLAAFWVQKRVIRPAPQSN